MYGNRISMSIQDAAGGAELCKRRERLLFGTIVQVPCQAITLLHHSQLFGLLKELHICDRDRSAMSQRREQARRIISNQIRLSKANIEHADYFTIHDDRQMDERPNAFFQECGAHIRPETIEIDLSDNGRLAICHDIADNPFALCKFHHLKGLS